MTKTNKKGTSLVELLAVIVIMGIIAAIAVPTVGALLKNTRQKAAVSDITTVVQSVESYLAGASEAEKKDLGVTSTTHEFTITFNLTTYTLTTTDANGKKIVAIFDTEQDTTKNIKGTIKFKLNDANTKISELEFTDVTYNKNEKGYTFTNGKLDTIKAKEGDAATAA